VILPGRGRLRSLKRHMRGVPSGARVVVGLTSVDAHREEARSAGFSERLLLGERVLPTSAGPVSDFNANGREIIHRDQPKETAYRQMEWTWEEWHGPYRHTRSRVVDIPYERYPRSLDPPPSVELTVVRDQAGALAIISDPIEHLPANEGALLHRINLLRELFGEAAILTEHLDHFVVPEFRRLNWEVLPPGEMPWPQLRQRIEPLLARKGERTRPAVEARLAILTKDHIPDFTAVGRAGFSGYLVFGFTSKGLFVMESLEYGNATYVFDENWEQLSQRTKAEILREDLQTARIIHREGWALNVSRLLR
jgi:hypothetical protein